MSKKWVYIFDELEEAKKYVGGDWDKTRGLLGGKGANLCDMKSNGIPVPPGFTVTTEACNAYSQNGGKFPDGMWDQELKALKEIEKQSGKKFGDPTNPLLVSCRSGAKFSMPGMMDTVLNIGMNDIVAEGMAKLTNNERFAYDSYRRLIQMYGSVVLGIDDEPFEEVLAEARKEAGVKTDSELNASILKSVVEKFKQIFKQQNSAGMDFPQDAYKQIELATEAVFKSWNGKRAIDYRNAEKIPHDLGTAVNIVTMVFGNMGDSSGTGVITTRDVSTGDKGLSGDYLTNAQGEDVVSGTRDTKDISDMKKEMPKAYEQLDAICQKLEKHYKDVQDIEFTVEMGTLWMLQTRDAKRTASAAVKIAIALVEEGLITKEQAVLRVTPEQIDFFLHPQFKEEAKKKAISENAKIATGLNVSPGAAVGIIAFDADLAVKWAGEGKEVVMVRPETKPDDVHGMLAAQGILTSRGGRTSHAALVARQFGRPAVVGVQELEIDLVHRRMNVGDHVIKEGDWISIDGNTGDVFSAKIETVVPDLKDPYLIKLLSWADENRRLQVWANADYPKDATRARANGAQGIGLCRTEHMFFEPERLPTVQKMILADDDTTRQEALNVLLPFQREDFAGLFRAMNGLPVIIRLIDPPMHEFLPSHIDLMQQMTDLKIRLLRDAKNLEEVHNLLSELEEKRKLKERVEGMHEQNPMLGLRGVRLGIHFSSLTRMQVRAIIEAACQVTKEGVRVFPEIMIPLTSHINELKVQQAALEEEAKKVMEETRIKVNYKFGTMIEIPRAALTSDQMAEIAQFFSFGTNDLTQTTFGISRDDAEKGFLIEYMEKGILKENPFASIDEDGVGKIMKIAVDQAKKVRPDIEIGICGEHGGDPKSVAFCHKIGLNYVSCSPFRVPIARLAAAQVALKEKGITAK
ncbi:MAG: pyruvate, phosphate dikinase [Leptospiraceae bacterium]|nr:pyruvate, phosphate dikinase [Leptospiraceae bacterium]MCP5494411.1 pyruvate, phosphate dikinase [Leptospiraceae bacterium]